ncbi:NUDIX hydrolase [bacterium]|nr:NUDIX hydrolase [bacterium]
MSQDERHYLSEYDATRYTPILVTVDIAIFTLHDNELHVLLAKRANHPAKGLWALPGGFIDSDRDAGLMATAQRKLKEKTGVDAPYLEQVETCGNQQRDPRGWSVTITYFALLAKNALSLLPDASVEKLTWLPVNKVDTHDLAFDHQTLIATCYERLKSKVHYTALPMHLLPEAFTLVELQNVFELILDKTMDKKSFRRRIVEAGIIEETGESQAGTTRRAKLYKAANQGGNHQFLRTIEGPR